MAVLELEKPDPSAVLSMGTPTLLGSIFPPQRHSAIMPVFLFNPITEGLRRHFQPNQIGTVGNENLIKTSLRNCEEQGVCHSASGNFLIEPFGQYVQIDVF